MLRKGARSYGGKHSQAKAFSPSMRYQLYGTDDAGRDYHRYFGGLFDRLIPQLQSVFVDECFYGFADHSPIDEKYAAAKAGLGVIGCHSLLINKRYGSYIFLGSILTSVQVDCIPHEIVSCSKCQICALQCPAQAMTDHGIDPAQCLSALSQKKKLNEQEVELLVQNHIAWGCDLCQKGCPHNQAREYTRVPYFVQNNHGAFCYDEIKNMTDEEFAQYAFSWRGRERILTNMQNLFEGREK